jgi:hypothetical protein
MPADQPQTAKQLAAHVVFTGVRGRERRTIAAMRPLAAKFTQHDQM